MRISDWSSDVCSSDLDNADEAVVEQVTDRDPVGLGRDLPLELQRRRRRDSRNECIDKSRQNLERFSRAVDHGQRVDMKEIGRASGREEGGRTCRYRWAPVP